MGARTESLTRIGCWLALWLLAAAAANGCARDFASFTFADEAGRGGGAGSMTAGRTANAGASGTSEPDAQVPPGAGKGGRGGTSADAGQGGGGSGGGGPSEGATAGSGGRVEAGVEDADAGNDTSMLQCEADWNQDLGVSEECRDCSCDRCSQSVVDCVTLGDPTSRRLCEDVFVCAMENSCQDFSCYCATAGCGSPSDVGDGPCAELMNLAADGTRSAVDEKRQADPPDYDEPLMRAVRAIGCVLGVHSASPSGPKQGRCNDACPPRN